jgi:hypothetical protein
MFHKTITMLFTVYILNQGHNKVNNSKLKIKTKLNRIHSSMDFLEEIQDLIKTKALNYHKHNIMMDLTTKE